MLYKNYQYIIIFIFFLFPLFPYDNDTSKDVLVFKEKNEFDKFINIVVQLVDIILNDAYSNGIPPITDKERESIINSIIQDTEIQSFFSSFIKNQNMIQLELNRIEAKIKRTSNIRNIAFTAYFLSHSILIFSKFFEYSRFLNIMQYFFGSSALIAGIASWNNLSYENQKYNLIELYNTKNKDEDMVAKNSVLINKIVYLIQEIIEKRK